MHPMKVIVIGGTGATGRALVDKLIETPWVKEIVVLVRRNSFKQHPKLRQEIVDFNELDNSSQHIKGEIAFSCLGTTLKIAGSKEAQWVIDHDYQYNFGKLCNSNGISTFVLLSALNANDKSSSFYGKMKGVLEKNISELDFNKLVIIRPSLLIRPGSSRALEKIGVKFMLLCNKIGLGKAFAPLEVSTVAEAMMKSSVHDKTSKTILEVSEIIKIAQKSRQ